MNLELSEPLGLFEQPYLIIYLFIIYLAQWPEP